MFKTCFKTISGGFLRTIGRILAYLLIGFIIAYFGFLKNAKAITWEDYKIGDVKIGSNNYVSVQTAQPTNLVANLSFTFYGLDADDKKYDLIDGWNGKTGSNGKQYYFALDYCSSVGQSVVDVYNSNSNQIAITKRTSGACQYSYTPYTALLRLTPTLYNVGANVSSLIIMEFKPTFAVKSQYSYNGYLYFNNLTLLDYTEYKTMLDSFQNSKELETNFSNLNNSINSGFQTTNDKLQSTINSVNSGFNTMNQTQQQTNNKLDSVNKTQQETNKKLDAVNNSITSEEAPNLSALENSSGWLPAGPLDSILNLPLSLLNNITTNLGKTCQPVVLDLPFVDTKLTLPCINTFYESIGISAWITTIGVIASAFILFSYFMKLYKWVDDTLSFRENNLIDNWGGI